MITAASATRARSPIHPDLGKELGVFHWDTHQARSAICDNALLFLIGLGLFLFFSSFSNGGLTAIALMGATIAATIWFTSQILKQLRRIERRAISLYELGLIDERSSTTKTIRYQQVAEIAQLPVKVRNQDLARFALTQTDGSSCKLNESIHNIERLGAFLQRACLPYQLPDYIQALQAHKDLNFGQVTINSQAVQVHQRSLSWQDFQDYDLNQERLLIWGNQFKDSVAIENLTNWHVLVVLLKELKLQAHI